MPLATRVFIDTAGGLVLGGQQNLVRIGTNPWAVIGDAIAGHGDGAHANATILTGSPLVRIQSKPVALAGHLATCGDVCTGSGFLTVSP